MTLITYSLRTSARCPEDEGRDHYDVEIISDHMIKVEELRAWFDGWAEERIYQENLATKTQDHFECLCKIVGQHPSPVEIRYG